MKALAYSLAAFVLFSTFTLSAQEGIIVEGIIKDREEPYMMLAHSPRFRGNLNFDGFRSIGSWVNEKGYFKMESPTVVHGADYRLFFPGHWVPLSLFRGDSIYLEVFLENPDSTFAKGRGAGKINVLKLPQLQFSFFDMNREESLQDFVAYVDSLIDLQVSLLDAIYTQQRESPFITSSENRLYIERIISESPLNPEEFEWLNQIVRFYRYSIPWYFMASKGSEGNADSVYIDLGSMGAPYFKKEDYQNLDNIDGLILDDAFDKLLQLAYARKKHEQEGGALTYGSLEGIPWESGFNEWRSEFMEENFLPNIYNKHIAALITSAFTLGYSPGETLNYLNLDQNNKYANRVKAFMHLLENGLDDPEYGLNHASKQLDGQKFKELVRQYEGKPYMVVFWSAQAAGASIVDELPYLRAFKEKFEDKMEILYICVDKIENKKLWAARIIDESWVGEHYFLPREGNEAAIAPYSTKDISSLCNGGAAYSFVDKKGEIEKDTKGPFYMDQEEMERFYELYLN